MVVFCPRCGASFASNYLAQKHANRRTPCVSTADTRQYIAITAPCAVPGVSPGVSPSTVPGVLPSAARRAPDRVNCEYCGAKFTSRQGKSRHKRYHCGAAPVAWSETATATAAATVGAAPVAWTQNNYNVTIHIHVRGYDPAAPITITREMIGRLFARNPSAREFLRLQAVPASPGRPGAASGEGPPEVTRLVTDMCMDLIEQYHADPANRNCWLNRASRDQIITLDAAGGKKKNTVEAQLSEFMSAVAGQISAKVNLEYPDYYREFGLEVVTALAAIPCWLRDPSPKIRLQMRPRFVAHMENMVPGAPPPSTQCAVPGTECAVPSTHGAVPSTHGVGQPL